MIPGIIKSAAKKLRKNMTDSEKKLWKELQCRFLGYRFIRQKPFYVYTEDSGMDRYIIPDFYCPKMKTFLEIEGSIHNKIDIYFLDKKKEKLISSRGYKVIRIQNNDIYNNMEAVIQKIKLNLN